ncbi:mannitol-1-phosphate 5-dehydrogenase [Terribacillus halophilus]|uniref:Mannitol-1-phosphate 5-dehydrogenase n=1 Tax=Terribacillus halophilus TaxID=361279 RepID=A0A1G6HW62_9BACI|nr:mannitol-1-phosphate 5-dehydrogenase [Terribacillus halophilus]SDB98461.1 mannitol-1-phosphate 5-dehydrogenase [Terribacillus halophilus]
MKSVHIGAGNIGRGFIGALLSHADVQVTFADVNSDIISALKEKQQYEVIYAQEETHAETITGVTGLNSATEEEAVIKAIAEADLVTTAVGPSVLPHVAPVIAKGLVKRAKQPKPIHVIACENMIRGSSQLREFVMAHVDGQDVELVESYTAFCDAAVDRIVPIQEQQDLLTVQVEPYFEWVVEKRNWQGDLPAIEAITFVDDLEPYIERKLLTVNTGHAAIAYAGYAKGYATIIEAIKDEEILNLAKQALEETSSLLQEKWGFEEDDLAHYIAKILQRYQNPYISDRLTRVGRGPIRKLGPKDRLVYPAQALLDKGKSADALLTTIAYALEFDPEGDEEAKELQERIKAEGVVSALSRISGQPKDSELVTKANDKYEHQKDRA